MKILTKVFAVSGLLLVAGCKFFENEQSRSRQHDILLFTLLGPPGAGKGTIAEQAVKELGFNTLSTGDMLREAVARGDEVGNQAARYMNQGKLVPDELITGLVEQWLTETIKKNKPIILDGYPRSVKQAELLNELLKKKFPQVHFKVLELSITDSALIKRISERLVCERCKKTFSKNLLERSWQCPECKIDLITRVDDQEKAVKERLKVYGQIHDSLVDFYKSVGAQIIELTVEDKTREQVSEDFKNIYQALKTSDTEHDLAPIGAHS